MNRSSAPFWFSIPLLCLASLWASGARASSDDFVDIIQATEQIPEDQLLDVGIRVFDPGIPDDADAKAALEAKGVFEDVRKSEARYLPITLKTTVETTGFWGAVRLVPGANAVDVAIDGDIVTSNGKKLVIDLRVADARGRSWLEKRHEQQADRIAYDKKSKSKREPFQSLYNRIANDLLKAGQALAPKDLVEIRRVAELKFAADLAPTAFGNYLTYKKGRFSVAKLPAAGDPMMARVAQIRERDQMFIDTLNEYYADLFAKMDPPYGSWRSDSYEEQVALDKLNRASKWEKILGAAAIVGGVMIAREGGGWGNPGEVAILAGMASISDSMNKAEQAKMHRQALNELAESFDSEASELLVDVEGEVIRLKGSVETQYGTWRQMLRQIFATEMGLPVDPNGPPVPEARPKT